MERLRNKTTIVQNNITEVHTKFSSKFLITPENIAHIAYPIANFIHEEKPDYILAFDRGARIIGLATQMLYCDLYGTLPTKDKKINFRKVSCKVNRTEMRQQFKEDVSKMLAETESPKVLLLDDWVITGQTKRLAFDLISEFSEDKAKVLFGVMRGRGKGADVSGDKYSLAYYAWRNKAELLGVDYFDGLKPYKVMTPETILYRKRVAKSVKEFSERLLKSS